MLKNNSFVQEIKNQHQLLIILQSLAAVEGNCLNDRVLRDVSGRYGFWIDSASIKTLLKELEEKSLISTSVFENVMVAVLTDKGMGAAQGKISIEGLPTPGTEPYF